MGGEVILVALDASKDTSNDYALEWTVQNMAKDGDLLILLVFLPSLVHTKPNLNRRLQSLACYYLSCGLIFTLHHSISVCFDYHFFSFSSCTVVHCCLCFLHDDDRWYEAQ